MYEQNRAFNVGDQVIHWAYGLGVVVQLDEKELFGKTDQYYVVNIRNMTIWVPINETAERCLRLLTPARDFPKLFGILASPGEALPSDRFERKNQLTDRMKDGTLESICRVIRDLALHRRMTRMNENDNTIQKRARSFLLDEWSVVLSVSTLQADHELQQLLGV